MIACVDVGYRETEATAACILFSTWEQSLSDDELVRKLINIEPYESGKFYKRELPCILSVLKMAPVIPDTTLFLSLPAPFPL